MDSVLLGRTGREFFFKRETDEVDEQEECLGGLENDSSITLVVEAMDGESISFKGEEGEEWTIAVFSTEPSNFMVVRQDDK